MVRVIKLKSGTFKYNKFESQNGRKSYRLIDSIDQNTKREIAIHDGCLVNSENWLTM